MGGGGHHTTVYAGSGGGIFSSIAGECGCTGSDPEARTPAVDQLLQRLVAETQARQAVPAAATESAGLETLLSGNLAPVRQPRPGPIRRDWNAVVCFSCGKADHSATRCPTLDESFLFMLPGWTVGGGYAMISPRIAAEHRRGENGD